MFGAAVIMRGTSVHLKLPFAATGNQDFRGGKLCQTNRCIVEYLYRGFQMFLFIFKMDVDLAKWSLGWIT